jgi:hypothetical protein
MCPKESKEPTQASPPTQDEDMAQEKEDQDQDDEILRRRILIKGEMKMINKTRKMIKKYKVKDRHT